jgi:hypothetical protein
MGRMEEGFLLPIGISWEEAKTFLLEHQDNKETEQAILAATPNEEFSHTINFPGTTAFPVIWMEWAIHLVHDRESKVAMPFDRPYGYEGVLDVNRDQLPEKLYHASPAENRDLILEEGLDATGRTWNTGHGWDEWNSETGIVGDPDVPDADYEYRPEGIYMWPDLGEAMGYARNGWDIWEIDTNKIRHNDIIKDPSIAHNWDWEREHQAYVTEHVPPEALRLVDPAHYAADSGFLVSPHDELYPCLWDGMKLREGVNVKLQNYLLDELKKEFDNPHKWIHFTAFGSGASYN